MKTFLLFIISCSFVFFLNAQDALTAKDYQQAESFLGYNTQQFIDRGNVTANWYAPDKFWYRILTADGSEFIIVDAAKRTKVHAFDHGKLAASLSSATGRSYKASMLPFQYYNYSADGKAIIFRADSKQWKCDLQGYACTVDTTKLLDNAQRGQGMGRGNRGLEVISPDGTKAVYIKEYNLFMRDVKSGKITQLTTDGIKDFGHPTLKAWKYPLPGDKDIPMIHRCVINVDEPKVIMLNIPPDPHRASLSDDISSSGTFDDIDWNPDGSEFAFLSTSRDHKQEKFRIANASTGEVREVFEEVVPTQYESGWGAINWRYLPKTKEIIWFSERDNWGHLYLYDAATGKPKHQITKGNWVVTRLIRVDEKNRQLYFMACGTQQENPYFAQFYKINFDGKNLTLLSPGAGTHSISFAPSENYFVDTWSKPDVPSVSVLRDMNGKQITELEKTDISRLKAKGWKPPTPVALKSADGKDDIYGLVFTPSHLDPNKKYPVVDYIYPGPQGGSVGSWAFNAGRGDHQALAELGFVVVLIEGTGNPLRSKSFHDKYWPDMSTNTLPDQVAGIRQLAQRYPYIDTTKVGMWGHSGGGFATAAAMFRYPDFFKVGISESGNHDNRNYEDDWGERYIGLLTKGPDGKDNYEAQANQTYAKNLKGKLMIAHGLMDNNVPPYNSWLVIEALTKANKDYDLVIFPNAAHGFGQYSPYMMRRRWDYFVKNLLGKEPPREYQLETKTDPRNGGQLAF